MSTFFISPPFGNWFNLDNFISIRGSFTLHPRSGLISQIAKTLRYSWIYHGWVNKIGLRNRGIDYAIQRWKDDTVIAREQYVTSVAILDRSEIPELLQRIPDAMNLEINVSCPNTEKDVVGHAEDISGFLKPERKWCIVKLSPTVEHATIHSYYQQGFRQFNCGNTYPVPEGGLSGPTLKPYHGNLIRYIKDNFPDTTVIATGGIRCWKDVEYYRECGADHFSVSTVMFNPYRFYRLWREIRDAR